MIMMVLSTSSENIVENKCGTFDMKHRSEIIHLTMYIQTNFRNGSLSLQHFCNLEKRRFVIQKWINKLSNTSYDPLTFDTLTLLKHSCGFGNMNFNQNKPYHQFFKIGNREIKSYFIGVQPRLCQNEQMIWIVQKDHVEYIFQYNEEILAGKHIIFLVIHHHCYINY